MMDPLTGETIFRNPNSVDGLHEKMQGDGNTMFSLFENAAKRYPQNQCLGTKVAVEGGFEYQWLTF
jgi:hypothetical protein